MAAPLAFADEAEAQAAAAQEREAQERRRPGFKVAGSYCDHGQAPVGQVVYMADRKRYASTDAYSLRVWEVDSRSPAAAAPATTVQHLRYPHSAQHFVSAMLHVPEAHTLFCACVDGKLRLYSSRKAGALTIKACLPWPEALVYEMHYIARRQELLVAGASGVTVYYSQPDHAAYARTPKDPEEIVEFLAGTTVTWAFGACQEVRQRMTLRVPSANCRSANDPRCSEPVSLHRHWVCGTHVAAAADLVFVPVRARLYCFDLATGVRRAAWEQLHSHCVRQVLYMPDRMRLVTATDEPKVSIWTVPADSYAIELVQHLPHVSAAVTALCRVPAADLVLIATFDGRVQLWHTETWQPLHTLKIDAAVRGARFVHGSTFAATGDGTVRLFAFDSVLRDFCAGTSAVTRVDAVRLGHGGRRCLMAEYKDCSIELLDAASEAPQLHLPPQLSSADVVRAVLCKRAARLVVLLANGALHAWDLGHERSASPRGHEKLGTAPMLAAVWNGYKPQRLISLAVDEGSVTRSGGVGAAARLGAVEGGRQNPGDLGDAGATLLAGTSDGHVVAICAETGAQQLRFNAHGMSGVGLLAVDASTSQLLTCAGCTAKLWRAVAGGGGYQAVGTVTTRSDVTQACALPGRAWVLGTSGGEVYLSARPSPADARDSCCASAAWARLCGERHGGAVTGVASSAGGDLALTCGADGSVFIWSAAGAAARTLRLGCPVASAAFLTPGGDLALAIRGAVMRVPAASYNWRATVQRDDDGLYRIVQVPLLPSSAGGKTRTFAEELPPARLASGRNGGKERLSASAAPRLLPLALPTAQEDTTATPLESGDGEFASDSDDASAQPGSPVEAGTSQSQWHRAALAEAMRMCGADRRATTAACPIDEDVAAALEPGMRRAFRILASGAPLQPGQLASDASARAKARKLKRRRQRKRRAARLGGLAALEKAATRDDELGAALSELRVCDRTAVRVLRALVPRLPERAAAVPMAPLGFQSRDATAASVAGGALAA